jgi:uncharacterized protein YdeI (YjbR/CyaY-like superfamily)
MRGQCLIGISAANRTAAGIAKGEIDEVDLQVDIEPREVTLPSYLADALKAAPKARAAFERLPFGLKRKHVTAIEDAKSVDVRERRIGKLIMTLTVMKQG